MFILDDVLKTISKEPRGWSGTFEWGGHKWGVRFSQWQANDAPMTQWALILTQQSGFREGICVICVARVCSRSCHTNVAYPPLGPPRPLRSARVENHALYRVFFWGFIGAKNWTQTFFFANFSGTPGISRQNPGISRQKMFDFPGFEGHVELFGPHPFTWKTPTPPENIRTQKFGFVLFFRAWTKFMPYAPILLGMGVVFIVHSSILGGGQTCNN